MSQLIPFQFEGAGVRVVEIDGEPWFVGKDICEALGYTDSASAMRSHCKGMANSHPLQTAGGVQEVRVLTEPDVLRLIINSRLPAAERFERWVFDDVLPTIRRNGSYVAPGAFMALPAQTHDRVSAILLLGEAIAKVPGVKPGIAMAATLTCVRTNTGIEIEELRRALPPADEPLFSHNASKLGKVSGASAKSINLQLAGAGLQRKNERGEWELTEHGQEWAEAYPFSRHGHAGYQILWNPAVLDWMRKAA
jgi:prophage antirepressor-like protein